MQQRLEHPLIAGIFFVGFIIKRVILEGSTVAIFGNI
jgi:hypothetical protein